ARKGAAVSRDSARRDLSSGVSVADSASQVNGLARSVHAQANADGAFMSAAVYPRTQIRLMLPSDLKGVAQVEKAAYAYPWSLGSFRDCLLAGYYSLVLDIDGRVTGYGIMSIAAAEAHVLNLCVHPDYQRLGYGRRMLNALLLKAQDSK